MTEKENGAPDAPLLPNDSFTETVLTRLYLPDNSGEPEEVLSHSDILASVRNIDKLCDGETLLRVMDKLKYKSRVVEGELCWFVKTPSLSEE